MSSNRHTQQREIYYSGRVQGVGFRYTTQRIASHLGVTGFVKNLSDGRVRVVAEGRPEMLDRLERQLEAEMSYYLSGREEMTRTSTGEFHEFQVRY